MDEPSPRHKAVGGLRLKKPSIAVVTEDIDSDNDADAENCSRPANVRIEPSIRQLQSDTRFPQRKRRANDSATPTLQPSSIDKLISGIWRQVHSPVTLSVTFPVISLHDHASSPPALTCGRIGVQNSVCALASVKKYVGDLFNEMTKLLTTRRSSEQSTASARNTMTRIDRHGPSKWSYRPIGSNVMKRALHQFAWNILASRTLKLE